MLMWLTPARDRLSLVGWRLRLALLHEQRGRRHQQPWPQCHTEHRFTTFIGPEPIKPSIGQWTTPFRSLLIVVLSTLENTNVFVSGCMWYNYRGGQNSNPDLNLVVDFI